MSMLNRRRAMIGAGAALVAGAGGYSLLASLPESMKPTRFYASDGHAIRGTDPVAYFTQGEPIPGREQFTHDWGSVTWLFASAENRALFA